MFSRFFIWRLIGVCSCLFSAGQVAGQSYSGAVNSISVTSGQHVIDSDASNPNPNYNRDKFEIRPTIQLQRTSGSGTTSATFRLNYQLRDPQNTLFKLKDSGGNSVTTFFGAPFTINFPNNNAIVEERLQYIAPFETLDPNQNYRWRVEIERELSPGLWTALGNQLSIYRKYVHFRSLNPADAGFNVVAQVGSVVFLRTTALDTATAVAQRKFLARLTLTVHRYDNWEAATPATALIPFRTEWDLLRTTPAGSVDLEGYSLQPGINMAEFEDPPSQARAPRVRTNVTVDLEIDPDEQMPSFSSDFLLRVAVAHREVVGGLWVGEATLDSPVTTLLHMNGSLLAAGDSITLTSVTDENKVKSVPDSAVVIGPVITGHVTGFPALKVEFENLQYFLRVYDDGHAEMAQNLTFAVTIPTSPSMGVINGVTFERQGVTFNSVNGFAAATIFVRLPAGLGYKFQAIEEKVPTVLESVIAGGNILLNQQLAPQALTVFSPPLGEAVFLVEESKPFALIGSQMVWAPNIGQFSISGAVPGGGPSVRYVRHAEMQAIADTNLPLTAGERVVRSNDLVYQNVNQMLTTPVVQTDASGAAKLTVRVQIQGANFIPHFPMNAHVASFDPGQVDVVADEINPALSWLDNLAPVTVPFARDAASTLETGCDPLGPSTMQVNISGDKLHFTRDGGLSGGGSFNLHSPQKRVLISYLDAMSGGPSNEVYVHQTGDFSQASFLMAGHMLSAPPTVDKMDEAPGRLLNTGFNPANLTEAHRPGSTNYANGLGDYPGMNVRVANESGIFSTSTLAGSTLAPYQLSNRSKYYARAGGVSGIHEPTSVPGDFELYTYDAAITNFGLSYLDSEVFQSVTSGQVKVPTPSDLVLGFEKLKFDGLGRPSDAELVGAGELKTLAYWNADIRPLAFAFQPNQGAECDPGEATLTLGVEAYVANLSPAAHGVLGFRPDGRLVKMADTARPPYVDSRLSLPTRAYLQGPLDRNYPFYAAHGLYFDDYDQAQNQTPGAGRVNLIGFLDVPFFEDLRLHLRTGASLSNPNAVVKVMAGWTDAGNQTPYTTVFFDPTHRGFPHNDTVVNYENLALTAYRVRARKDWLNLVNFDYELEWSSVKRTFRSRFPTRQNLVVLQTEHELTYMDPLWADIDFGANLNLALPELNLQSLAGDAFMLVSNEFEAQIAGAASDVAGRLIDGLDSGAGMLKDRMEGFYDRLFGSFIDPMIDQLATQIVAANENLSVIQGHVDQAMGNGAGSITERLRNFASGVDDGFGNTVVPLVNQVDGRLAEMQLAIRAVIGRLDVDQIGGQVSAVTSNLILNTAEDITGEGNAAIDGLFARDATGYNIVENLLQSILTDVSSELAVLLTAEVDAQISALLERASPTIEQVKGILMEVHNSLGQLRQQLADGVGFYEEIQQRYANAVTEIEAFMEEARTAVNAIMSDIRVPEYDPEELKAMIRQEIRDRFNATQLVADVQEMLKQRLQDLDALVQESIATLFAEVNQFVMEVITQYIPSNDNLEQYLGDLANVAAAGSLDGYARIEGDSLRHLRLDGKMQLKLPDDFEFRGYLEINQLDSFGDAGCSFVTGENSYAAEVKLAALDVGADWIGDGLRFSVGCKFTFDTGPSGFFPRGMGGFLDMTEGEIKIEAISITSLAAGAMFGIDENYVAARVGMKFDQYEFAGGVFLGRTCTMDPLLLVDPDFGDVLGNNPPFTGIYTYGEGQVPIFGASCLFSLQAIAGAGIFIFAEGPTFGGKMKAGVVGKALCAVEVGGEVTLMGTKQGNDFSFMGRGRIFGSAGVCPLCVEFDKSVQISYRNRLWDYDF